MEDAHTVELSLADDKDSAYFAVFDGHGSHRYSKYCGKHLHKSLILNAAFGEWLSPSLPDLITGLASCPDQPTCLAVCLAILIPRHKHGSHVPGREAARGVNFMPAKF